MGRTLLNFFRDFPPESLSQLYFHKEVPTTDACTEYFRITDFDILKKKKRDVGTVFNKNNIQKNLVTERVDEGVDASVYSFGRKRKPYMYLGRNFIWSLGKWKNKRLFDWLNKVNPDIIFFASGDYTFSYKIAMTLADYKKIPIVTYVCDDYYFLNRKSVSPLYYLNRFFYKKTLKKLFLKHKNMVAICDKITTDYGKEFGTTSTTVMTTSTVEYHEKPAENPKIKISYIGNLGLNRHITLCEIARSIKEISDGKILLDVYSGENRKEIVDFLDKENSIDFHGRVDYSEVIRVMHESDILIHTEAMDESSRNRVRYSVSTKIADSLSCGTCLFAYGPADVASIEYLKQNDCACVVTDENKLKSTLRTLINDETLRNAYVQKALNVAAENHNEEKNSNKIKTVLETAIKASDGRKN